MASTSRTRTVASPVSAVWGVLADFGALSSWADGVDHSCLLEHSNDGIGVGTSRRVQVGRITLVERIAECSPPDVLAYEVEGLPRMVGRVWNRWVLAGHEAGTRVTLTSTVRIADNPVARAVERTVCRLLARQSDALLDGLAQRVEDSRV